jgi:hypothetical protein
MPGESATIAIGTEKTSIFNPEGYRVCRKVSGFLISREEGRKGTKGILFVNILSWPRIQALGARPNFGG